VVPFAAKNYLFGVSRVHVRDYLIGTALGKLPGTIILTALGTTGRAAMDLSGTARWSLLGAGVTLASDEVRAEQHARHLLARYGVVFRELAAREILPPWRDLLLVLRRLEARGDVRGGRFVAGFVGEQFAVPTAVAGLRALRPDPSQASASPLHIPATLAARDPIVFVEQAVTRLPTAPITPIANAAL
jgi:hypothetical protein